MQSSPPANLICGEVDKSIIIMMNKKNVYKLVGGQKGFTIIELIVVIAIIAVLAAIVMVNVTSYIGKSKDAAIRGNMQTIATSAAAYYDTNKNYDNMFATTVTSPSATIQNALVQINSLTTNDSATTAYNGVTDSGNFCLCAQLSTANNYCVDASGYRGEKTGSANACSTLCPSNAAAYCH